MENKPQRTSGLTYLLLSHYRSELMGFAMLWVMLFHAYPFSFRVTILDNFKALGFGGVDIFIFLSGLGIYVSMAKRDKEPYFRYLYRRFSRVLPAYWLIVGIYSLWLRMQHRISLTVAAWSLSTLHYWFQIPGSFNWYVPVILLFYTAAPLWGKALRRCPFPGLLTAFTFPLSYLIYRIFIPLNLHYMEDFLFRIPTFAAGMLLGYYITEKKALSSLHLAGWTAMSTVGVTLAVLVYKKIIWISTCYMINTNIVLGCLLAAKLLDLLQWKPVNRILRFFGEYSLEIYLLNVIITREFNILNPIFGMDSRHIVYYVIVYAINIVLAIPLHRAVGILIPWCEKQIFLPAQTALRRR